jgi:hypothetical protein
LVQQCRLAVVKTKQSIIRDSSVGITTSSKAGVRFPLGVGIFLISTKSRPALGPTQPPSQWIPGVKRPVREGHYSPTSSAEVKNYGSNPPLPHTSS